MLPAFGWAGSDCQPVENSNAEGNPRDGGEHRMQVAFLNGIFHSFNEGRGAEKLPGEIRRSQNWIGGVKPGKAVYVPPPPHMLAKVISDVEKYLHIENSAFTTLVRAVDTLITSDVLVETTGKKRDR